MKHSPFSVDTSYTDTLRNDAFRAYNQKHPSDKRDPSRSLGHGLIPYEKPNPIMPSKASTGGTSKMRQESHHNLYEQYSSNYNPPSKFGTVKTFAWRLPGFFGKPQPPPTTPSLEPGRSTKPDTSWGTTFGRVFRPKTSTQTKAVGERRTAGRIGSNFGPPGMVDPALVDARSRFIR